MRLSFTAGRRTFDLLIFANAIRISGYISVSVTLWSPVAFLSFSAFRLLNGLDLLINLSELSF